MQASIPLAEMVIKKHNQIIELQAKVKELEFTIHQMKRYIADYEFLNSKNLKELVEEMEKRDTLNGESKEMGKILNKALTPLEDKDEIYESETKRHLHKEVCDG